MYIEISFSLLLLIHKYITIKDIHMTQKYNF